MFRKLLGLALLLTAGGCATSRSVNYVPELGLDAAMTRAEAGESLFAEDQAVISSEAVAAILNSQVALPARSRVAVLQVGPLRGWPWWSEDVSKLEQTALQGFLDRLRQSERVGHASVFPAMLAPPKATIPHLRAAAARYQADLMLIYRVSMHSYQRQKAFTEPRVRAYCMVEAALIDVRSGIVPFATVTQRSYQVDKTRKDVDFAETIHKAEIAAFGEAMNQVAEELLAELKDMPVRNTAAAGPG